MPLKPFSADTQTNLIWNVLEEVKSIATLAGNTVENVFVEPDTASEAAALIAAMGLIVNRIRTCQQSVEFIEQGEPEDPEPEYPRIEIE
jgi:hypothetical protein